jgi:hypothetical protein
MTDLKDFVIAAHGGLDRWNQRSEVRAHLLFGGVLWQLKKQDGVLNDAMAPGSVGSRSAASMDERTLG